MFSVKQYNEAIGEISNLQDASKKHHDRLCQVLQQYTTLADDYRRLTSDYEKAQAYKERCAQMVREQERSPFALVLIDGNGYIFHDDLISNGAKGGKKAARLLNEAVHGSLRLTHGMDGCQVMVRIYMNLAGLSKTLSKVELAGCEKRSLAPFVAGFNRSHELFDIVDAGELQANVTFKVKAVLRQFAHDVHCRHIFFAGCHDTSYVPELTPKMRAQFRMTLVKTHAFHQEFASLQLPIEEFSNVFRSSPLDIPEPAVSWSRSSSTNIPGRHSASNKATPATICFFHQKGSCRYGSSCRNLHLSRNAENLAASNRREKTINIEYRQQNHSTPSALSTSPPAPLATNEPKLWGSYTGSASNLGSLQNGHQFQSHLTPRIVSTSPPTRNAEDEPNTWSLDIGNALDLSSFQHSTNTIIGLGDLNKVPVNESQHRLDVPLPPVSRNIRAEFQARIAVRKLCNKHHIEGNCSNGPACGYDHAPISDTMLNCLKQTARSIPCGLKGSCRLSNCMNGHLCYQTNCKHRGGLACCRFGQKSHTQSLEIAGYEPAIEQRDPAVSDNFAPSGWIVGGVSTPSSPAIRSESLPLIDLTE